MLLNINSSNIMFIFFPEQLVKKYIIEGKNAAAENATA